MAQLFILNCGHHPKNYAVNGIRFPLNPSKKFDNYRQDFLYAAMNAPITYLDPTEKWDEIRHLGGQPVKQFR